MTDLPKWKCHKEVQADKIVDEGYDGNTHAVSLKLESGESIVVRVLSPFWERLPPGEKSTVGGYYVRYEDGYESWSPAKAFEDGYTRI